MPTIWLWVGFSALVVGLLVLDLGVFHRKSRAVSIKEAALWSCAWIGMALLFNLGVYFAGGPDLAVQFLTGYLIEKSLSVDNIFVFALIFTAFGIPAAYQHRVLFWGVIGALCMRGLLILLGAALLETFHWMFYIFGAFLIIIGIRMVARKEKKMQPENNPLLRLVRKFVPVTETLEEERFFLRRAGKFMVTPLLLTLIVVEVNDLIFALDSIPAIFAVTENPFIVYTSNVFAMLGLRSLYFVFAGVIEKLYYLKAALALILVYVGVKLLIADWLHMPTWLSLVVVAGILAAAIVASLVRARKEATRARQKEEVARR